MHGSVACGLKESEVGILGRTERSTVRGKCVEYCSKIEKELRTYY